jgi:N4-(beta-N-acetylglucosaminyl)-L-asparaginase
MAPIVIASANGHQYRNGGTETCVERVFRSVVSGVDTLQAIVDGVGIVELDADDTSVGFGSLPNAAGVVQLDASCMHGPRKRAGAVAALEGVATAAAVAHRVMLDTPHHLLVGQGAQDFARACGFEIRHSLLSPRSFAIWEEWKRRLAGRAAPETAARGYAIGDQMSREGLIDRNHLWGTINCNAVGPDGALCGVTTTSGLAWKIPGRVGDSPILGAGLYVRGGVGAAGSTGRGESTLYGLSSFQIVDAMRRGAAPKDAALAALRQICADTLDPSLLNARGTPNFNVKFYVVNAGGEVAGVALYGGDHVQFAVCTENGAELRRCEALFDERDQFLD